MTVRTWWAQDLADLEIGGRLRVRAMGNPFADDVIVACSNDYLGYALAPHGIQRGVGAGGSRLVVGTADAHRVVEEQVSAWVGQEDALVFCSGYAANVGVVSALAGRDAVLISDERNHASLIDGCRLGRATTKVVGHGSVVAVEEALAASRGRRVWVVVESYYSMDGTVAPVGELRRLCDRYGAGLVVDEAHALGIFGPRGAGLCAEQGIQADVLVGTFGKALGAQGAFVASASEGTRWIWNRARSFVFSTGMSPLLCEAIGRGVAAAQEDDAGRQRLWEYSAWARRELSEAGLDLVAGSLGPIIAIVVGDDAAAMAYEARLLERRIVVRAIRPPTVARGTARMRLTLSAAMTPQQVQAVVEGLVQCAP